MKRFMFLVASAITVYVLWWTPLIYKLPITVQITGRVALYLPIILLVVMGILLRRVIFWPFGFMRRRAEVRDTSRALAERYRVSKGVMDKTVRRI